MLALLQQEKGAGLAELMALSGWQVHGVRGFLSGVVKKQMGLQVRSDVDASGTRRYRVTGALGA